ncbi:MAG TPA: hypothetical protein VHG32_05360, partial [Thermoanaerobaculia bacterium]|nr:hypothetical protein [Thermoanaerobaculia bacterium]
MSQLIVLPTLERLYPYDRSGQPAIGVVFAVALGKGNQLPAGARGEWQCDFLRPWSWQVPGKKKGFLAIQAIKVFYRGSSSDDWLDGGPVPVARQAADGLAGERLDALRRSLDQRFECFRGQTKNPANPGNPWQYPVVQPVNPDCRPWPAFLGHVSQLPWPLPQALGLSYFERLSCEMTDAYLVAAPILRLRRSASHRVHLLVPQPPIHYPKAEAQWVLEYGEVQIGGATARIRAFTSELPPRCKTACFFDLESLWIRDTEGGAANRPTGDWRSGLENRLATQLDAARVLLDWLRDPRCGADGKDRRESLYPEAARQLVLELRRNTLPALGSGFIGGRLLRRLAAAWSIPGQPFAAVAADDLDKAAGTWFEQRRSGDGLAPWLGWVTSAMDAAGGTPELLALAAAPSGDPGFGRRLTLANTLDQLDALVSQLASPGIILEVFRHAWKEWLTSEGAAIQGPQRDLAQAFADRAPSSNLDLAHELLRASAGKAGAGVLGQAFDPEKSANLADQRTRLKAALSKPKTGMAGWDWLHDQDSAWLGERAEQVADTVLPADPQSGPAPRTTTGLTVQVDGLSLDRKDDRLQDIQGVAMLMRDASTQHWCCLNMAEAWLGEQQLHPSVLLPARLAYLGELSAPTLTYDNQPLAVAGPLADAAATGVAVGPAVEAISSLDEPLVDFRYCRAVPAGRLPELVFGHDYLVQPFLVSNSGAIPEALTGSAMAPWGLKTPIALRPADMPGVRTLQYRRDAPVGALRFAGVDALPTVPADVAPRLRELPPDALLPAGDPLLGEGAGRRPPETAGDSILTGTPLLLLAGKGLAIRRGVTVRSEFSFKLASPTTDLRTWDRWVADCSARDRRKFVWRSFHELANESVAHPRRTLEEAGVFLDDPAVVGIWAELVSFSPCGDKLVEARTPTPIVFGPPVQATNDFSPWKTDPCTLRGEQRPAIPVSGHVDEQGDLTVSIGSQELKAAGGLYRLTLYAVLSEGAEARFRKTEVVRQEGTARLTSPWHLLIEVAKELYPPRERSQIQGALWQALAPSPACAAEGVLEVGLDLASPDLNTLAYRVSRADLLHQVWTWRGRPPAEHPDRATDASSPPPSTAAAEMERYLAFEMAEFGERSDDERRHLPMQRVASADGSEPAAFSYQEKLEAQGPAGDFRALHHRFAVRVFSRYRGVVPDEVGFLDCRDAATLTRWRRLFVPCRFRGTVPPPNIKFVLPLTQESPDQPGRGPGLLVAVDGPWYEVGGLAEELAVEVMTVMAPGQKEAGEYFQAGTDPIVTGESAGDALGLPRGTPGAATDTDGRWFGALSVDDLAIDWSKMTGAIGHARDHTTVAPHVLASSFLLAVPTIKGCENDTLAHPQADLAWWFFKLRFARRLRVVKPQAAGEPGSAEIRSEWSAPFWVQLLPALDRVEADWFGGASPRIRLTCPQALTCEPPPAPSRSPFYLFAVMTRGLRDFAGRSDQEAYVGVWWQPEGIAEAKGRTWETDLETEEQISCAGG